MTERSRTDVRTGAPSSFADAVSRFVPGWRWKPYRGYESRARQGSIDALAEQTLLAQEGVAEVSADASGAVFMFPAPWDSERLGMRVATLMPILAPGSEALALALTRARAHGYDYLFSRVDAMDDVAARALIAAGFRPLDAMVTFAADVNQGEPYELARTDEEDAIAAIARPSFMHDRFHDDPAIPRERADDVYEAWARNACRSTAADAVVVERSAAGIDGFVTVSEVDTGEMGLRLGRVGLVVTNGPMRGRGVASRVMRGTLTWAAERGLDLLEVGTQIANVPAMRLYISLGFAPVASHLSFRYLTADA